MKAIILAAGYATRLYPLTKNCPKALLPINGRPIIDFILDKLTCIKDIDETIVVSNDKFNFLFSRWLRDRNSKHNIKIINDMTKSEEDRLGAIGDLGFVINREKLNSDILVIAGDNLFNFALSGFIQFSRNNSHVSVGIYDIKDLIETSKYGVVKIGKGNFLTDFVEKPDIPFSSLIAVGIYFMPNNTLKFIDEYLGSKNLYDALGNYIRWLLGRDKVLGYKFNGTWYDIGDINAYEKAGFNFTERGKRCQKQTI